MELRDLRYFCLTAELEHVSKAAEKLGVSQPFLTKIITRLENELGTQLFDNVGRHISLNRYGEVFYAHAKKVLAEVDGMLEEMDELLERQQRSVTLVSDSSGYTPELMFAYKRAFPDNLLSITYEVRGVIFDALATGRADFALTTPPIGPEESRQIETVIVYSDSACVLLPPGSPLHGKGPLTLDELRGLPLVTSPRGAGVRNNLEIQFAKYAYEPNIVCESIDMELLIRAAMNGLGFAFMPHLLTKDPRYAPFCEELNVLGSTGKIGLSCLKVNADSPVTSHFREFVVSFFADYQKRT